MYLVGPVINPGTAFVAVVPGQQHIVGDARRAEGLNGPIHHAKHHVGDVKFDGRNLVADGGGTLLVDVAGRAENHQPRRVDLYAAFGNESLNKLFLAQHHARLHFAGGGAAAHQIERAFGNANPTHTVVNTARPQAFLRQGKAHAFAPDQVGGGHAAVGVTYLGMATPMVGGVAHDTDVAH